MIKGSLPYVLCRIEDDSSITPVSQHEDYLTGLAPFVSGTPPYTLVEDLATRGFKPCLVPRSRLPCWRSVRSSRIPRRPPHRARSP